MPAASSSLRRKASPLRGPGLGRVGVEQRQLVGQQAEHLGMGVGGLEQPRDRVAGARGGVERGRVVAQRAVGGDRVDAGHREQVAASLVQDRADVEERLQPGPEAAARAPRALGDRAEPAVRGRVQVQDPVGLAVADRAQHDRLGLQRSGHGLRPALSFLKL